MPPQRDTAPNTPQEFFCIRDYGRLYANESRVKAELISKKQELEESKKELEAIRKENTGLKVDKATLKREFAITIHELDNGLKSRTAELEKVSHVKSELKKRQDKLNAAIHNEEISKLTRSINKSHTDFSKSHDQHQLQYHELERIKLTVKKYTIENVGLTNELGIIPINEQAVQKDFEDLASKFHKLSLRYFFKAVSNPSIIDSDYSGLQKLPQLVSNTTTAQLIRCAFAEALIAKELLENIFVDFYVPQTIQSLIYVKVFVQMINKLREKHPDSASVCGSQFASICGQYEDMQQKIVSQATKRVFITLQPWISDEEKDLADRLIDLLNEAMSLWKPLQRSKQYVKVQNDGDWNENDTWPEYSQGSLFPSDARLQMHDYDPFVITFPRILIGETLIFRGRGLYRTEAVVFAARQERDSELQRDEVNNAREPPNSSKRLNFGITGADVVPNDISSTKSGQTRAAKGGGSGGGSNLGS